MRGRACRRIILFLCPYLIVYCHGWLVSEFQNQLLIYTFLLANISVEVRKSGLATEFAQISVKFVA